MRIRSLVLDDASTTKIDSGELPNGLVVFFSADERRKTFALEAVRRLLFSTEGNGGSGRSTAFLSGPNGDFELSTNGTAESETLRKLDGQPAGPGDLGRLFGRNERADLRRVFDIAGRRLADETPHSMAPVAPTGAGSAEVRARMQALLGDDQSGEIDRLIAELEESEARLEQALLREAALLRHLETEKRATDEVGRLCAELAELRRRRERLQASIQMWPIWEKRMSLQRELDELEPIDDFPEDDSSIGEARRRAEASEEAYQSQSRQQRQLRAELDALPEAGDRHEMAQEIEAVCGDLSTYRERMTAFARLRARHAELANLVPQALGKVSETDGAMHFDPNELDSDAARQWVTRAEDLNKREERARSELEKTRADLKQLRSERSRATRAAGRLGAALDPFDEQWRALWAVRDGLDELWQIQSQGEAAARTAEKRAEEIDTLDQRRYRLPAAGVRKGLWVIVALSFSAALFQVSRERATEAMILCAVALAAMVIDLLLGWRLRWAEMRNRELRAGEDKLHNDLHRSRQLRDARWRKADEISERVALFAEVLDLDGSPSLQEVEAAERALFAASQRQSERGPLTETALAIRTMRDRESKVMDEVRETHRAKDAVALEWDDWKHSVGLPAHLDHEELTTYLCEFDRWRELANESEQVDEELRALAPAIEEWEEQARALLADLGVEASDSLCGRDLEDQLFSLRESARRSLSLAQQRGDLEQRLAALQESLTAAENERQQAHAALAEIRRRAGTNDEQEYDRRREIFVRRQGIKRAVERVERDLAESLAEAQIADSDDLRACMASGDLASWSEQATAVEEEIARLEAELEGASHERVAAASGCRELEESLEVTVLQQQCAALRTEIQHCAERWRCLALADSLLSAASQGAAATGGFLLNEASTRLRALTAGELVRLASRNGNGELVVVDRSGVQHDVDDDLAPAFAQQINLSLHLAIARDFARGTDPIPFVMDEVLANLDADQVPATAAEIAGLAREQQVFYFTAQRDSLNALLDADAECRVIELD